MRTQDPIARPAAAWMMLGFLALIAPLRVGGAAPTPGGQSVSPPVAEEEPLRRVELLVFDSRPSQVSVGLHIELSPGWYLYWLNPGDAGLAPEVSWQLPPSYEAGKLRFPTPRKFVHGDIVTYGFTDETLILCDIRRPGASAAADKPAISAVLDWMACRESCVLGKTTVRVDLSSWDAAATHDAGLVLSRFWPRYPKPLDSTRISPDGARLIKSPGSWRIEILIPSSTASRVSDFYPYPLQNFVIAHSRIASGEGKLVIPVEPSSSSATLSQIDGLFIIDGSGFEVSIPVKE
jgi:DsbC/DsbD-like thiol-disulfide interchange protein